MSKLTDFLSSADSVIGGIFDNTIGQFNSRKLAKQQLAHQKELARIQHGYQLEYMDKAYDQQLQFWNEQNEYNTPLSQRKRLEEANYNVMDIARNGGAVNTSGQLSPISTPQAGAGTAAIGTNTAQGVAESASRIRLNEALADQASTQARKNEGETVEPGTNQKYMDVLTELQQANVDNVNAKTALENFDLALKEDTRNLTIATAQKNLDILREEYDQAVIKTDMDDSQRRILSIEAALKDAEYTYFLETGKTMTLEQMELCRAKAQEAYANAELTGAKADIYKPATIGKVGAAVLSAAIPGLKGLKLGKAFKWVGKLFKRG